MTLIIFLLFLQNNPISFYCIIVCKNVPWNKCHVIWTNVPCIFHPQHLHKDLARWGYFLKYHSVSPLQALKKCHTDQSGICLGNVVINLKGRLDVLINLLQEHLLGTCGVHFLCSLNDMLQKSMHICKLLSCLQEIFRPTSELKHNQCKVQ